MNEMPNLPPRYYQRPNSLPRFLLSLLTLFIMLGALPIGVYLVGQRTDILPQAAPAKIERPGTVSFSLERDLSPGFENSQTATASAQIAINLLVHSDDQAANLFVTRVSFPSQYLELVKVATGSGELAAKWIQSKVDNNLGQVDLIAGVANPGIKTQIDQRYVLTKLTFNIKGNGVATFHLDPDSTIFDNRTNQPLAVRKNDLTLDLPQIILPFSSPVATKQQITFKKETASLTLISPQGGETISYTNPATISWNSIGLDQVSINLLINGQKLGRIASASASLGKLNWKPADFLLPTLLTPVNTYQIEVDGTNLAGQHFLAQSAGPFAIVTKDINSESSQSALLTQRGGDANKDGKVDLTDLSILLSSFGKTDDLDLGVDLNGDGVVNDVDLWLFKGVLLR